MDYPCVYRPEHPEANKNGMISKWKIADERPPAGPFVISDHMSGALHPVTGRVHDSKSNFRRDTRAAGCEEVGNEPIRERPTFEPTGIAQDIKASIEKLRSR